LSKTFVDNTFDTGTTISYDTIMIKETTTQQPKVPKYVNLQEQKKKPKSKQEYENDLFNHKISIEDPND